MEDTQLTLDGKEADKSLLLKERAPYVCEECGGTGRVECNVCDGTGENVVTCNYGYEHTEDCDNCFGNGEVDCISCDGQSISDDEVLEEDVEED